MNYLSAALSFLSPATGDNTPLKPLLIIGGVAALLIIASFFLTKKKK